MNHLGGMVVNGLCLVVTQGPFLWFTLCISLVESHPGTKGFEMPYVKKLLVQPLGNMGSAWIIGCNNLAIWTVGGSGMIGWSASIWSKGRLLKGPVLVKIKSFGESAQPLQIEESKYLAMSLVLDNLSIKTWKLSRISSSQFLSKNLWLNKGEGSPISIGGSLVKFCQSKT